MITRRNVVKSLGMTAAVAAIGHTGLALAQQKPVKINFGYIADAAVGPLIAIANKRKLWEKYGLEANLVSFTNGPSQVVAMEAGSLDAGFLGAGAMWLPAVGRVKVLGINLLDFGNVVLGQPGGGTTMASLKGKEVGVSEGTSGEMILRQALAKEGMTMADIQKINLDPATLVPAFIAGRIAAAAIWFPPAGTILQRVPDAKTLASDRDFPTQAPVSAFVARLESVKDNREGLVRLMTVLQDAMDYRVKNMDETIRLTSELTTLSQEIVGAVYRNKMVTAFTTAQLVAETKSGKVIERLESRDKLSISMGKIKTALPASQYYQSDIFLEAAARVKN